MVGVGDGQGGLVCCSAWGLKELDGTERLNWTDRYRIWILELGGRNLSHLGTMASFTCPRPHQSLASTRLFLTFCDLPDLWRQVLVLATDASSAFNLSRVRVLDFKESKCLPLSGVKAGRNWPGNCLAPSPMKTANTHTHTEAKKGLSWVLVSGSPICLTFCQLSTGHQLSTGWFFFSYFFSLFLFFFFIEV